jgi:HSP20 family protein
VRAIAGRPPRPQRAAEFGVTIADRLGAHLGHRHPGRRNQPRQLSRAGTGLFGADPRGYRTAAGGMSSTDYEVGSVADLVPVRRGSTAPARREEHWPQSRRDVYSPFAEFDELWDRMVSRFFAQPMAWPDWSGSWTPAVDVEETGEAWIFEVELPGARRDDVQVDVSDTELIISGTMDERERSGVVRRRARRSGSFEYRATLPAGIDAEQVDARFDNGLLTVRVPRPERAKTRHININ